MAYRLDITSRADRYLAEATDYLYFRVGGFGNPLAAKKFLDEYAEILGKLSLYPKSYQFCEEEKLRTLGYRRIHFSHLDYKVFYHIDGNLVVIDLICHDSQDYQNLL